MAARTNYCVELATTHYGTGVCGGVLVPGQPCPLADTHIEIRKD